MKITVDLPDSDLKEICLYTGERKKGPAIRKLVTEALRLKRREMLALKFVACGPSTVLLRGHGGELSHTRVAGTRCG